MSSLDPSSETRSDAKLVRAEPKCPECQIQGVEHIVSTPSAERSRTKQPWFYIVHCAACGYVYNTLSKHTFSQAVTPNFVLPKTS